MKQQNVSNRKVRLFFIADAQKWLNRYLIYSHIFYKPTKYDSGKRIKKTLKSESESFNAGLKNISSSPTELSVHLLDQQTVSFTWINIAWCGIMEIVTV